MGLNGGGYTFLNPQDLLEIWNRQTDRQTDRSHCLMLALWCRSTVRWDWTVAATRSWTHKTCRVWRTTKFKRCSLTRTVSSWERDWPTQHSSLTDCSNSCPNISNWRLSIINFQSLRRYSKALHSTWTELNWPETSRPSYKRVHWSRASASRLYRVFHKRDIAYSWWYHLCEIVVDFQNKFFHWLSHSVAHLEHNG